MSKKFRAALFDLDGVIVDTAKYHYMAWKNLARQLGFDFTERDNERLKGVSRVRSLEILLEIGQIVLSDGEKVRYAIQKNEEYVAYIQKMDCTEILPGARECLLALRARGVRVGLGSASKNSPLILNNLKIIDLFDAVVDGNKALKAKPDPQVFLMGAEELGIAPVECVVFEDAEAGIQAAKTAGMFSVGIGSPDVLVQADLVVSGLDRFDVDLLF